jgi:hypothetical protein
MTPEHLAKLQAGREAKRQERVAAMESEDQWHERIHQEAQADMVRLRLERYPNFYKGE